MKMQNSYKNPKQRYMLRLLLKMFQEVNTLLVFKHFDRFWHMLGLRTPQRHWGFVVYDALIQVFVSFWYPLHVLVGLFSLDDAGEVFSNMMITVACLMCSIKHFLYRVKFEGMDQFNELIGRLDGNVASAEQKNYHRSNIEKPTEYMFKFFLVAYPSVGLLSVLLVFLKEQPALIYPAWFPFDWQSSTLLTAVALCYQCVGVFLLIFQNIINDSYAPITLCIVAGHVRLLGLRIEHIGDDERKKEEQHYEELTQCIEDYKCLLRAFNVMQDIIAWNILFQSVSNGVNLCVCVVYLVFYAKSILEMGFGFTVFFSLCIEFYPCCYYGSVTEQNFYDLTYAIFSCKWVERKKGFQHNLRIFSEMSLRRRMPSAKNMVNIHLDTYFATVKAAYSLFCLILNYK